MGNNVSIDRDTPIKLHKLPLGDIDDIPYSNDITIDNFLQILSSIHKLTIMTNTEYESLFHNNPITKKTKTSLFTPPRSSQPCYVPQFNITSPLTHETLSFKYPIPSQFPHETLSFKYPVPSQFPYFLTMMPNDLEMIKKCI